MDLHMSGPLVKPWAIFSTLLARELYATHEVALRFELATKYSQVNVLSQQLSHISESFAHMI